MKNSISILTVSIALSIVPSISCSAVSKTKPSPVLKPSAKPQSPTVPVVAKPKIKPGTVLWEYATKDAVPIYGSPSLYQDKVCFGDERGNIHVVDTKTGKLKSTIKLSTAGFPHSHDTIISTAAIKDGNAFFSGHWVNTLAYDLEKGKAIWVKNRRDIGSRLGIAIGSGHSVIFSAYFKKSIKSIDSRTGEVLWSFLTKNHPTMTPSIDSNNVVYVGSEDGFFYALDGDNGNLKWKYISDDIDRYTSDRTDQAAIGADGTLYVCGVHRQGGNLMVALDSQTGREKWTSKFNADLSTPVIDESGTIFVGAADGHVYAVDQHTGKQKMRSKTPVGRIVSSLALGDDGMIYFGSQDRRIYAISGKTLEKKWEVRTGGFVDSSPLISKEGVLYIGSDDGRLYAISTSSTGPAKSPWPMFGQNAQRTSRAPAAK